MVGARYMASPPRRMQVLITAPSPPHRWARYKACDDPGPVTHADVLCAHNCVDTHHNRSVDASRRCFMDLPRPV